MADDIKNILKTEGLHRYVLNNSYPREHKQLKGLRAATAEKYDDLTSMMNVPVDEGLFLSMFLKLMNAKKAIEVGVFTGYSLLTTALALPDDGTIIAIDPDQDAYEVGLPYIREAGVENKIKFVCSDAMSKLDELLNSGEHNDSFDYAFIDADKSNYKSYYEKLMKLVKVGGVIAIDNTLWLGTIAMEEDEVPIDLEVCKADRGILVELNEYLSSDPRIELSLLSIGDGLTLCKRLV